MAAGWDALRWAERIAPDCWGNAAENDAWVLSVRCLTVAAVVTGRSSGCAHTVTAATAVPVVAVARIPDVLCCPPCAEPIVAQSATMGLECDRCGSRAEDQTERVAALTGSSLIVVAQLCLGCRSRVFELVDDPG
jgi:ribosomal protein L37AE/L43A